MIFGQTLIMSGCATKFIGEALIYKSAKNVYSKFLKENDDLILIKKFGFYKIIKTKNGLYFRFWNFHWIALIHYSFPSSLAKPYTIVKPAKLNELLNYWFKSLKRISPTVLEVKDSISLRKDYIAMMRKKEKKINK